MPKALEDFVQKRLAEKDFYPEKKEEERKSIAYAIGQDLIKQGKLKGTDSIDAMIEFLQVNAPTEIRIHASGEGDILIFKNAILARAETNLNNDEILPDGIQELASSIGGRPIDYEHRDMEICGVFTDGRPVDDGNALSVDGMIWADRWPEVARGIQNGTHGLSVEADAAYAKCSVCQGMYKASADYCEHLQFRHNRKRSPSGARRILHGLKGKGGAVTARPAGTDTRFDKERVYMVASHQEVEASWYDKYLKEGETVDDLPASDFADPKGRRFPYKIHGDVKEEGWRAAWSAAHGGHTGVKDESAIEKLKRDKPKGVEVQEGLDDYNIQIVKKGDLAKMDKADQKTVKKSEGAGDTEIDAELEAAKKAAQDKEEENEKLKAEIEAMKANISKMTAEYEAKVKDMECKVSDAEAKVVKAREELRHSALHAFVTDEEWTKQKETVMKMDDASFNFMAASLAKTSMQAKGSAGLRLPDPGAGGKTNEPLEL